ncbi:MAG: exodeoxyribonuclease III [Pseudomonadota bacterium]
MPLKIATWNINSVRLRRPLVEQFLKDYGPDILCLQEIKCQNDQFPAKAFAEMGYPHQAVHGQKAYHGVATISKRPLREQQSTDYCEMGDTRHVSTAFDAGGMSLRVHNFYVPAGGDEPDREKNPKFAHKLDFVEEMKSLTATHDGTHNILVGDLNIAPLETDVWSHKQLLKIVSHTPVETEGLLDVMVKGGWHDFVRQHIPVEEKVYSWWSYRARDWDASDRGRRLDHVWGAPELAQHSTGIQVLREARGWEKPSDHVPIILELDLD